MSKESAIVNRLPIAIAFLSNFLIKNVVIVAKTFKTTSTVNINYFTTKAKLFIKTLINSHSMALFTFIIVAITSFIMAATNSFIIIVINSL